MKAKLFLKELYKNIFLTKWHLNSLEVTPPQCLLRGHTTALVWTHPILKMGWIRAKTINLHLAVSGQSPVTHVMRTVQFMLILMIFQPQCKSTSATSTHLPLGGLIYISSLQLFSANHCGMVKFCIWIRSEPWRRPKRAVVASSFENLIVCHKLWSVYALISSMHLYNIQTVLSPCKDIKKETNVSNLENSDT